MTQLLLEDLPVPHPFEVHEKQLHVLLQQAKRRAGPQDYARLKIVPLPKSGSSIAYYELGDPEGQPLLCLHGLSITGFFFEQYHEYFRANRIRAIAPCLLGGISETAENKTIDELATELIELLDVLRVQRFDMIGFSWGTLPELALVARIPDRIRRAGLLGPMLPLDFLSPEELARMKPDVRMSLRMAGQMPWLHRGLMWLVCRLPVSVLVDQFKDDGLSPAEAGALASGTPFRRQLARCLDECRRTGSRFFTDGWRMFLDAPGYRLDDLAAASSPVELRLYIGEQDNVHLPSFAYRIAAAHAGTRATPLTCIPNATADAEVFRQVCAQAQCSIWMAPGAGRMACMLYLTQALENLLSAPRHQHAAAACLLPHSGLLTCDAGLQAGRMSAVQANFRQSPPTWPSQ